MNIVRISDGLGNQMFQYAFARKIQILSKRKVYLDTRFINHENIFFGNNFDFFYKKCCYREFGLNHFKITLTEADEHTLSKWKFIDQKSSLDRIIYNLSKIHFWPWQYIDESYKESTILGLKDCIFPTYFCGYFFNIKYFDDIKYILRKEFQLKNPLKLTPMLQEILYKKNTIGIHVRKGDFTKLSRDISKTDYYLKALTKIKEYIKDPLFLIFSDDIEWVKNNIDIMDEKIYISDMGFSDYEEFTIMKYCKHNIIANSTFSYWAAYLNNNSCKIVVCPKRWKINIIPKDWICV